MKRRPPTPRPGVRARRAPPSDSIARGLLQTASVGIIVIDQSSRIVFVNRATEEIFGYGSDEMLGEPLTMLMPERLRPTHLSSLARYLETGERHVRWQGTDLPALHRSGREVMVAISFGEFASGGRRYFTGVVRDVTARRGAEGALRGSEARLRAIFENEPECVKTVSADGRLLDMNPAGLAILEVESLDAVVGQEIYPIVVPEHRDAFRAMVERVFRGEKCRLDFEITTMRGARRWMECHSVPLRGDRDEIVAMLSVARDVTEARAAVEALRRSEERFEIVSRATNDAVWDVVFDTQEVWWNEGIRTLFGYSTDDVRGDVKWWKERIHPDDRERIQSSLDLVVGKGWHIWSGEYRFRRADDSYAVVADRGYVVRDASGKPVRMIGAMIDVTERRRAEEERRLLQELTLAASEAEDLQAALDVVIRKICGVTGWVLGQAWIPHPEHGVLECSPVYCCTDARLDAFRSESVSSVCRPGEGLPGRVWSSKHAEWIPDVSIDPNFPSKAAARRIGLKAGLGIPVLSGEEVAAVLEFFVFETREEDERLIGVVSTIALQLGSLIRRKRIEERLRQTEKKYRSMFENAVEGIFQSTPEGRFVTVNPALARILGYESPEELMASITDIRHQLYVDPSRRDAFQRNLAENGYVTGFEYEALARNGRRIWISETARAVRDEDGTLLYYEGTFVDVTERKRAEEALRESEERYREMVENAHDVIFIVDLKGNFLSINTAGERISGYTREEIMRMNIAQVVAPDYLDLARRIMEMRVPAGAGTSIHQLEMLMKDGRKVAFEISARVLRHRGRAVAIEGIARDLTERRHLEEQLRQAQKMEAIGSLAGGVAHDFNNLLTAIIGYSELLMINVTDDALRKDVEEIKRAGERAAALTSQLLAFSRRQVLQPKVLELNAVVADMDKMIRRLIGEDITLLAALDAEPSKVKADPSQIEQVILNLAVNARDAMPRGGMLTIATRRVGPESLLPRNHVLVPGSYVVLSVGDSGVGIPDDVREHIFEPFFTTKEIGKGTGLGLSTVYGVVKQSGGYIWVDSRPGQGTTFTIYLPASEAEVQFPVEAVRVRAPAGGSETVLLVEDEEVIRALAGQVLEKSGYTVLAASSGEEALAIAEGHPAPIHLLLTDVVMPAMSGPELARRLAASRPETLVLFMSGYTEKAVVHKDVLQAEKAFLMKPFTPRILAAKVRSVLDQPAAPEAGDRRGLEGRPDVS